MESWYTVIRFLFKLQIRMSSLKVQLFNKSPNKMSKLNFLAILGLLASCALALPNNASYIKANGRPLNIAHRGLASILPENTLEAFEAALYQGADFIELDVVYTQEKIALVMHDPYLTRITNIRDKPEFESRMGKRIYNGKIKNDWWTDNFTLKELKTLGVKQDQYPGRNSVFDFKFTFPTLEEVVEMVISFNQRTNGTRNPDGRLAGILIEAKDSQMYRNLYNLEIGATILDVLKKFSIETIAKAEKVCPIYLHSFDYGTVKYWADATELPRNYLLGSNAKFNLTDINKYATGIGFADSDVYDYSSQAPNSVLSEMKQLGMETHVWTFKDESPLFNQKNNIEAYKYAQQTLKLDGVITEFADIYTPLAQLFKDPSRCSSESVFELSEKTYRNNLQSYQE